MTKAARTGKGETTHSLQQRPTSKQSTFPKVDTVGQGTPIAPPICALSSLGERRPCLQRTSRSAGHSGDPASEQAGAGDGEAVTHERGTC